MDGSEGAGAGEAIDDASTAGITRHVHKARRLSPPVTSDSEGEAEETQVACMRQMMSCLSLPLLQSLDHSVMRCLRILLCFSLPFTDALAKVFTWHLLLSCSSRRRALILLLLLSCMRARYASHVLVRYHTDARWPARMQSLSPPTLAHSHGNRARLSGLESRQDAGSGSGARTEENKNVKRMWRGRDMAPVPSPSLSQARDIQQQQQQQQQQLYRNECEESEHESGICDGGSDGNLLGVGVDKLALGRRSELDSETLRSGRVKRGFRWSLVEKQRIQPQQPQHLRQHGVLTEDEGTWAGGQTMSSLTEDVDTQGCGVVGELSPQSEDEPEAAGEAVEYVCTARDYGAEDLLSDPAAARLFLSAQHQHVEDDDDDDDDDVDDDDNSGDNDVSAKIHGEIEVFDMLSRHALDRGLFSFVLPFSELEHLPISLAMGIAGVRSNTFLEARLGDGAARHAQHRRRSEREGDSQGVSRSARAARRLAAEERARRELEWGPGEGRDSEELGENDSWEPQAAVETKLGVSGEERVEDSLAGSTLVRSVGAVTGRGGARQCIPSAEPGLWGKVGGSIDRGASSAADWQTRRDEDSLERETSLEVLGPETAAVGPRGCTLAHLADSVHEHVLTDEEELDGVRVGALSSGTADFEDGKEGDFARSQRNDALREMEQLEEAQGLVKHLEVAARLVCECWPCEWARSVARAFKQHAVAS